MAPKGHSRYKWSMTLFDESNRVVPTVVKAGAQRGNPHPHARTRRTSAVQLAYGEISPRKVSKPLTGPVHRRRRQPTYLAELRLDDSDAATEYQGGQS